MSARVNSHVHLHIEALLEIVHDAGDASLKVIPPGSVSINGHPETACLDSRCADVLAVGHRRHLARSRHLCCHVLQLRPTLSSTQERGEAGSRLRGTRLRWETVQLAARECSSQRKMTRARNEEPGWEGQQVAEREGVAGGASQEVWSRGWRGVDDGVDDQHQAREMACVTEKQFLFSWCHTTLGESCAARALRTGSQQRSRKLGAGDKGWVKTRRSGGLGSGS